MTAFLIIVTIHFALLTWVGLRDMSEHEPTTGHLVTVGGVLVMYLWSASLLVLRFWHS